MFRFHKIEDHDDGSCTVIFKLNDYKTEFAADLQSSNQTVIPTFIKHKIFQYIYQNLHDKNVREVQLYSNRTLLTSIPLLNKKLINGENDQYTVQGGETLVGISSLLNIPVETLKQANGLTSNSLVAGQVLTIPATSKPIN